MRYTVEVDFHYLAETVLVRFLHYKVPLQYSVLWKKVIMHSPHSRSEELYSHFKGRVAT